MSEQDRHESVRPSYIAHFVVRTSQFTVSAVASPPCAVDLKRRVSAP